MKEICMLFGLLIPYMADAQALPFHQYPIYPDNDLGLTYQHGRSSFKIWSPTAEKAELLLYVDGLDGDAFKVISMDKGDNGTWNAIVHQDLHGIFYAFRIQDGGKWLHAVPDPYAKSVGVNGKRA
ncbi:MAG: type I pullulanase, partial [Chitinophagaceae bacterium]